MIIKTAEDAGLYSWEFAIGVICIRKNLKICTRTKLEWAKKMETVAAIVFRSYYTNRDD